MKIKALAGAAVIAVLGWYSTPLAVRAQVVGDGNAERAPQSVAEFEEMFEQVSNWGRWGDDDEIGLMNLVTNEKRRQAAALVRTGIAVSLAHTLVTEQAVDMPNEAGRSMGPFEMTRGGSTFRYGFHSTTHSHVDAICQFDYQGELYNGFKISEVKGPDGCTKSGIEVNKAGFTTRGVLLDIPRLKGVPYLEPGTPVYPEDFEAWEKEAGVTVQPGDAIFLRTGRWARRAAVGPWNLIPADPIAGEAGYHPSTIPWIRERDVAIIAADVSNGRETVGRARGGAGGGAWHAGALALYCRHGRLRDRCRGSGRTGRDGGKAEPLGVHGHRRADGCQGRDRFAAQSDGHLLEGSPRDRPRRRRGVWRILTRIDRWGLTRRAEVTQGGGACGHDSLARWP